MPPLHEQLEGTWGTGSGPLWPLHPPTISRHFQLCSAILASERLWTLWLTASIKPPASWVATHPHLLPQIGDIQHPVRWGRPSPPALHHLNPVPKSSISRWCSAVVHYIGRPLAVQCPFGGVYEWFDTVQIPRYVFRIPHFNPL